jgi:penicillin-binding protein 1A
MHPQLVSGAWVGFDDSSITMGDGWGPGARSALPIVADVYQQALRGKWIDVNAEFPIPRSRPEKPQEVPTIEEALQPITRGIGNFFDRLFKGLR